MGLIKQIQTSPTMPKPAEGEPKEVEGLLDKAGREPANNADDDLTPEEREAYDAAMKMASEMLYKDDTASNTFVSKMKSGAPEEALPETVSAVIEQIEMTFQGQLPEGIILPLADEISDIVIELADTAGIIKADEAIATKIKGNAVRNIVEDYGATEEQVGQAMQGVTESDLKQMQSMFGGQ